LRARCARTAVHHLHVHIGPALAGDGEHEQPAVHQQLVAGRHVVGELVVVDGDDAVGACSFASVDAREFQCVKASGGDLAAAAAARAAAGRSGASRKRES